MGPSTMLVANRQKVLEEIAQACARVGRDPNEVTLITVSKTQPISSILTLYEAGERIFGENRPQELRDKRALCPADISWHMIGHLQKNKIKYVIEDCALIHSVDSCALAEAIQEEAVRRCRTEVPILLEVNMAGEDSKWGFTPEEVRAKIRELAQLSNLRIHGLMTVAPFVEDPEENRSVFRGLRQLGVDITSENIDNVSMNVLSMGMTNDFSVAIEEGATCVRVGTAIFGARTTQF